MKTPEKLSENFWNTVQSQWEQVKDKENLSYRDFFEKWRRDNIKSLLNQLEAIYQMKPPAVIKIKKREASNYIKGE